MKKNPAPDAPLLKKLQGRWNIVSLEIDGHAMPVDGSNILIEGERFSTQGMGAVYSGRLSLDDGAKPWAIDLRFTDGPEKGNVNRGIFDFQRGKWRLCLQMAGGKRPSAFSTEAGPGLALEILERASASARKQPRSTSEEGAPNPGGSVAHMASAPKAKAAKNGRREVDEEAFREPVPELEGEWQMTSCIHNGTPLESEYLKWGKRVAQGNETTVLMGKQTILKAKYRMDRTESPIAMDYLLIHGPSAGQQQFGICEIDGDTFRVSFAPPGEPRPRNFDAVSGDGCTVTGWKRITRAV